MKKINKKLSKGEELKSNEILLKARKLISRHSVKRLRLASKGVLDFHKISFIRLSSTIIESQKNIIIGINKKIEL